MIKGNNVLGHINNTYKYEMHSFGPGSTCFKVNVTFLKFYIPHSSKLYSSGNEYTGI